MKVIQTITRLPDKFSLDELLGEIKMLEEIEKGHGQFDRGQSSEDQMHHHETNSWFG
jgi:hypothetical protein